MGYLLSILIGISLGFFGAGGSILAVPLMVYVFKLPVTEATGHSLLVVGGTALVGSLKHIREKQIDLKQWGLFAVPSFLGVYTARNVILTHLPQNINLAFLHFTKDALVLFVLAIVMVKSSLTMINGSHIVAENQVQSHVERLKFSFLGFLVGVVTGFVGAGGGVLIIPVLIRYCHMTMRRAVGTSLLIITANALFGFFIYALGGGTLHFQYIVPVLIFSIGGIFFGNSLHRKIKEGNLKKYFGYFVLLVAGFIVAQQLFKN